MAATGLILQIVTFVTIFSGVCSLYEDQVGTFDWRQQYIGRATRLYWEQQSGSSGGKRLYVATDKNVIASINTATGNLVWRKVFEEDRRGQVDDMVYNSDMLVLVLGGRRVLAWAPATGNLLWDVLVPGNEEHRGVVRFSTDGGTRGLVVAMTSKSVYGLQLKDGSKHWEVELPNSDIVDYQKLLVHDGTVYAVGMTLGSEVKVIAMDMEGETLLTKSVLSGFQKDSRCELAQDQYLVCYCKRSDSLQVLNLRAPQGFVSTSIQDLNIGVESIQTDAWSADFSSTTNGLVIRLANQQVIYATIGQNGRVSVKKHLPKAVAGTVVTYEGRDYLLGLVQSGHEEMTLTGCDLGTGEELAELNHKIHYAGHNGFPAQISGILAKRVKDGKMAYKLAIVSEDYSLQVVHKNGKVAWRREESVAYAVAVEMVDLPVSENQAKFEDEFGSQEDNLMTMFVKRFTTQFSQLQTFIIQQIHRLQGVKHHSSVLEDIEEDEDEEDFLRDEFSLHKMLILVTAPGKIIGMKSMNGHIVWQHFIPELAPFDSFGKEKVLLHTQRTTAHFPHHPQCVVVGKNRRSGRGHLYAFNPISGHHISQMPVGGVHLTFNIVQAFLLGEMDDHFLKGIIMMDEEQTIHTFPVSLQRFVRSRSNSIYMYVASPEQGTITGYRIISHKQSIIADNVWTINIQNPRLNLKITNIATKMHNEHVHSQGRVLGDRSVLYKYLNPNIVVITAEGEEPATSQQKGYPFINVYLIDVVSGNMIFHGNHRKAQGPVHVLHSENWVVYNYFNTKQRRYEMAALEMYEGKEQSNSTTFSSFTAPTQPLVMRQSFIFPIPLYTMATTLTEKGITSKDILVALKTGGIFSLPKAFLDPRRPLIPTQETAEEGTLPYIPELPVHTEAIINYNLTLHHVRAIHTAPTGLESTSLVLAYGLDLFHTRVQPSKMFDVLKEDFEHWLIASVVLSMLVASFISQKLAGRKALNKQWK